ncbi:RNA polymerase sigma factor [Chitinophaga rhizosphaerae]|uniref:RNA polymerase sigma factor n=1 Tax=Chitinophaga rhizosphaerae TaxID=1864947 RepID=UPI000F8025F9|nr:DUF6596 domain-containing protein [Chitinophaga rhizosphaerae]
MNKERATIDVLFQQEFSKMVAVISRQFGLEHIETAEDIVGDTFLTAAENWAEKGIPENPAAWLYVVAKQKTLAMFRRGTTWQEKVLPAVKAGLETEEPETDLDFSAQNIQDSQLRMIFAICNPAIASESQIGLALRILCGFGIDEIAAAFLTNKETINKRLFRAKEKLRTENIRMELPPEHLLDARLDNVLHIIYLLFNEGYYSRTQDAILQKDLCLEAMRLGLLLTAFPVTAQPRTFALIALMCFHASRFEARESAADTLVLYDEQDENLWDRELIRQGMHFLGLSATGNTLSSYHLEARIAFLHCRKEDTPEKWLEILAMYNELLIINYSPSAALNRTFALYKAHGADIALVEAEKLQLTENHFYWMLLGELTRHSDPAKAATHYQQAYDLAKTAAEKEGILRVRRSLHLG